MKKILLLVLVAVMALSMAACGAGNVGGDSSSASSGSSSSEASSTPEPEKTQDVKGLKEYMLWKGYVSGDEKEMAAEFIGAKEGVRYQFQYEGSNVTVELYEFDTENRPKEAADVMDSVKKDGKFTIMNQEIEATLSDNEKYLMIYTDGSTNEKNVQRKEEVVAFFKAYE